MKGFSLGARIIFFGMMLFSFSSCFQYPEGPIFTMQTKDERLEGNWLIEEVTNADGNDVTAEYADRTLFVEVNRDSKNLSYFKSGLLYSFGTYAFADNTNEFIVIYTQYQGADVSKEVIQIFWDIRKLTDNKFYYIDNNGIEFHWKKN